MFERLRKRWSSLTHPIIVKLGDTDPNILTCLLYTSDAADEE